MSRPKHDAWPSEDDGEEDFEGNLDANEISHNQAATLGAYDEPIREKFLNRIAELLSHTTGGKYVTVAALREKEDRVEVDIARNSPFESRDLVYLASLSSFMRERG